MGENSLLINQNSDKYSNSLIVIDPTSNNINSKNYINEIGKQTEDGYLSSITGITLKNDPERIRGTRGKLVLWEEGGKFPNLLTAWRVEQPAVETDDGKAFGLMISIN